MCPDPALLVAYLDGTLFHRDKDAVDRHLSTCAECVSLLEDMRAQREAERASRTSRSRALIGGGIIVVAIAGVGLWTVWPRSNRLQTRDVVSAPTETRREAAATPARVASAPPARETAKAPKVNAARTPNAAPMPRRVLWRTSEMVVESSTDGGVTWVLEHTADRPIRAGAFVDATVAWVVGDNGLILRRTKNGWFGATPPEAANITAVRASSPSRATVTLEDGRVFSTENGGVTWSLK